MKIWSDVELKHFEFWSGAKETVASLDLSDDQWEELERLMEETASEEGWSDTAVNDLFWFESDTIKAWLNITDYPKFFRFDNKLGRDTIVSVEDEDEETKLTDTLTYFGIDYMKVDENAAAQSEYEFDYNAQNDFLWNEDEAAYVLRIPNWMPACVENNDYSGLDDNEIQLCNEFCEEYPDSQYYCAYDEEDDDFCIPDIGNSNLATDCITCRIYER